MLQILLQPQLEIHIHPLAPGLTEHCGGNVSFSSTSLHTGKDYRTEAIPRDPSF